MKPLISQHWTGICDRTTKKGNVQFLNQNKHHSRLGRRKKRRVFFVFFSLLLCFRSFLVFFPLRDLLHGRADTAEWSDGHREEKSDAEPRVTRGEQRENFSAKSDRYKLPLSAQTPSRGRPPGSRHFAVSSWSRLDEGRHDLGVGNGESSASSHYLILY